MRQDRTYYSIQLLRAVAATLVVLFHAHQAFAAKLDASEFWRENYLFAFGAVGVHIFFVISGFIIVFTGITPGRSYSVRRFFRRRFLRIYPTYWLCALVYVGVHSAINQPYAVTPDQVVRSLLLWPEDASRLIGPSWTLSFEMYFYLCFGLAMILGLTRGLGVLAVVFLGAIALGPFFPEKGLAFGLACNPLLVEFLAGAAVGWLAHAGRLPLRWGAALVGLGMALFVAGLIIGYDRLPSSISWGIPSALVVFGLVSWETKDGASRTILRLARFGDSSYILYLMHILVITLAGVLCQTLSLTPAPMLATILITPVAIMLSESVYRWIEAPLLRLVRHGGRLVTLAKKPSPRQFEIP